MVKRDSKSKNREERINPATMRRLVLARELFYHAQEHSVGSSPVDRMIAIHNFHNAIEVMLKAIVKHQEISLSKDPIFFKLQKAIDNFLANQDRNQIIPFGVELKNLNTLRNQVQHDATVPAEGMMTEWKYVSYKILRELSTLYFVQDFNEISSLDLVINEDLKGIMKLAERKMRGMLDPLETTFSNDDEKEILYYEVLALLTIAFGIAYGSVMGAEPFEDLHLLAPYANHKIEKDEEGGLAKLESRIRELEVAYLCQILGIDYSAYKILEQANIGFGKDKENKPYIWMLMSDSSVRPTLISMFSFVKKTIQDWQSRGWVDEHQFRSKDPLGLAELAYLDGKRVPVAPIEEGVEFEDYLELSDIVQQGYFQYSPVLEDD